MSVGCLAVKPIGKPDCNVSLDEPVTCLVNKQKKFGVLKFIGETDFSGGIWCGVELREACGKNDGTVAGKRYFKCAENHGIFVNPNNVHSTNPETRLNSKQVKRTVLPNVVQESCPVSSDNEENKTSADQVLTTQASCDDNSVNNEKDFEGRPRSKSDNALVKNGTDNCFHFNNSPFKCDMKEGKSSSLSKLDNVTFICHSPILGNTTGCANEESRHPRHSSPLAATKVENCKNNQVASENSCPDSVNVGSSAESNPTIERHHHVQLSTHFEIKQSIKIGHIGGLSSSSLKGQESHLNKTFLINSSHQQSKMKVDNLKKIIDPPSELSESKCNGNLNSTFVSNCESDGVEVRSRSASKSSFSSLESFSSAGSIKTRNEKSHVKSMATSKEPPKKLTRASETSKSKLVKISAESKVKPKSNVTSSSVKGISVLKPSGGKPNDKGLINKSRTKSTSVFRPSTGSGFHTPAMNAKTNMKLKSKSVSSEYSARVSLNKNQTSKFATPLAARISGGFASRLSTNTPLHSAIMAEKRSKFKTSAVSESMSKKTPVSVIPGNCVQRNLSQESIKSEKNSSTKEIKKKDDEKRPTKQEDNKVAGMRTRNVSTSKAVERGNTKNAGVKSSTVKSLVSRENESLISTAQGSKAPRKVPEKSNERLFLKKKTRKFPADKAEADGNLASCLNSALTPDLLKQTPEATRQSVGVQVRLDNLERGSYTQALADQCQNEREKVKSLVSQLSSRNREFEATLIALQFYSQKVDVESKNMKNLIKCVDLTNKKCLYAEKKIVKETNYRVRLEDEMLSVKSDSVVEMALLKAGHERKQDLIKVQLMEDLKQELEKARRRHAETLDEIKRICDLKLKRVEETYVEDIAQINEKHRDNIADIEVQHSKVVEELVEERHAEIETIKEDYEEQMEEIKNHLSESEGKCHNLAEKLKITKEESKRDIELRIQDAIAKYKSLPDELESMKFVLEMKNNALKKIRQSNMELQNQIDELQRVKNRATLLEREKESLNFVVENKVHFERQLSRERDKLRRSLDREVAASKRLSLENEELTWRLNSFQNSPTSPTFDRVNWQMSSFSTPDNAAFSQMIEESDLELQMDDTKETSN